jgi:hypothetical protein
MDKITQALSKILPTEQVNEVAKAVEEMMADQVSVLQEEFQDKLNNAYEQLAEERKSDEVVAEAGYEQAYQIINSLMTRLDEQRQEFESALEEGFEEAYSELQKEKSRNQNIEVEVYQEADEKLQEMKNMMVDKLDQFLAIQETEIYESARRDVLSDPRILEQRVALEKITDLLSDYIGHGTIGVSANKVDEAVRHIDDLKGQLRIVEAKNVRLSSQNSKMNEQIREAHNIISEATKIERTNRVNKKRIASGRGQRVVNEQIISEYSAPTNDKSNSGSDVNEAHDPLNDLLYLSGINESY